MPPSQLNIATSSLQRLIKEEASYHAEQASQEKRIAELEKAKGDDGDENREFMLKQEVSIASLPRWFFALIWEGEGGVLHLLRDV